jgi:hypothetical protein
VPGGTFELASAWRNICLEELFRVPEGSLPGGTFMPGGTFAWRNSLEFRKVPRGQNAWRNVQACEYFRKVPLPGGTFELASTFRKVPGGTYEERILPKGSLAPKNHDHDQKKTCIRKHRPSSFRFQFLVQCHCRLSTVNIYCVVFCPCWLHRFNLFIFSCTERLRVGFTMRWSDPMDRWI